MAAPITLTESINQAADKAGLGAEQPEAGSATPVQSSGSSKESPQESGQGDGGGSDLAFLGIESADDDAKDKKEAPSESGTESKLDLQIPGDTVVGLADGKPVTAAQVAENHLLRSTFTQKTQEFAEYRKQTEPVLEFVAQNQEFIQPFAEAGELLEAGDTVGGKAKALAALQKIAASYGLSIAETGSRQRDAQGRFVAQRTEDAEDELESLIDEYGEDSVAVKQFRKNQELEMRLSEMTSRFEKFESGISAAQQAAKANQELNQVVSLWTEKGVDGINAEAARALIGQPMSAEHAMQVANLEQLLKWFAKQQSGRPNEPGRSAATPASIEGKTLSQAIADRFPGMR